MMEQVHNSVIRLAYLKTEDHTADILTKPLPPSSHWHHMEPLLGENPAIAAIMEDVAHIKGRAVCLHVDVRRVPKSLTFHADVRGGGEAGAPGAKDRELAGEQLTVEQALVKRREAICVETGAKGRHAVDEKQRTLEDPGSEEALGSKRRKANDEPSSEIMSDRSSGGKKKKKKPHGHCYEFSKEGSCSRPQCPFSHTRG